MNKKAMIITIVMTCILLIVGIIYLLLSATDNTLPVMTEEEIREDLQVSGPIRIPDEEECETYYQILRTAGISDNYPLQVECVDVDDTTDTVIFRNASIRLIIYKLQDQNEICNEYGSDGTLPVVYWENGRPSNIDEVLSAISSVTSELDGFFWDRQFLSDYTSGNVINLRDCATGEILTYNIEVQE